jgi:hypothetical protein
MTPRTSVLHPFLSPRSVAVFGGMQENGYFGAGVIVGDLLKWGYPGPSTPFILRGAGVRYRVYGTCRGRWHS